MLGKTVFQDSAYTEEGEGVWSGGESRGPTPVSDNLRVPR